MNFLKGLFLDGAGLPSMGRFISLILIIISIFIIIYSIITKTLNNETSDLIKWLLGFAIGGKTLQGFSENIQIKK